MNEELTADELLSILQGVESDSENVVENVGPEDDDSEVCLDNNNNVYLKSKKLIYKQVVTLCVLLRSDQILHNIP